MELRSTYKWGGGPDKTILHSAARHDPSRHDLKVVYLHGAGDTEFEIPQRGEALGVPVEAIPETSKIDRGALKRIAALLDVHKTEILHAHDYKTNLYGYLLTRRRPGLRLMTTAHGWTRGGGKSKLYNWVDLRVLRRIRNIIAVSGATRKILLDNRIPEDRITLIHNAIDEEAWSPQGIDAAYRREQGLADDVPLIGNIGRLSVEKDLFTWIDAARRIGDRFPQARFVVVGEGALESELRSHAEAAGLADRVDFAGFRRDLPQIYKSLDLHLMSSTTEGLPNALLEAMSMGIPTVSTDVGGIAEIVKDGYNGLLYAAGDAQGLASGAIRFLEDPDLGERIRKAGRDTIEQEFSFSARMRKIERYYDDLAGRSARP